MRTDAGRVVVACSLVSMLALACGRRAELYGEEDAGVRRRDAAVDRAAADAHPIPPIPDGGVPVVEAGLDFEDGGCSGRPVGCTYNADFPCQKFGWFEKVVELCREQAGCVHGWLSIRLDGPGCVSELGMTDPNADFVMCLADELKKGFCPCPPEVTNIYLGECP
jgi:hypothetical protein